MNKHKLTNYVKKLAALTASTVCGTALLAALAAQVKAATFSYFSEKTNSTWEIETPGDSGIPESWDGSNILSIRATFGGEGEEFLFHEGPGILTVVSWQAASFDFFQDGTVHWYSDQYLFGGVSIPSEKRAGTFSYEFQWNMESGSFYVDKRYHERPGCGYRGCFGPPDSWTQADWTRVTPVPEPTAGLAALSVLGLGAVATRRQRRTPSRR